MALGWAYLWYTELSLAMAALLLFIANRVRAQNSCSHSR